MMRILFLVTWLTMSLFAAGGELSLYVLKDGKPLPEQQVVILELLSDTENGAAASEMFGAEWMTDAQGYLTTAMPEGRYQLQLLATDNGTPQAFVKKNFVIASGKQTQIILSLKTDNTLSFADVEAPADLATEAETKKSVARVNGTVALTLLSGEDEKPVQGARVFVPGVKVNAISDAAGYIVIDLPEGNQTLSIIHTSYSSQSIKVTVLPKEMVSRTVELSPAAMELEEFVVLAPQVEGSIAAVMAEVRNSETIANVIGSAQMSKQGDSNAASALKRVPGITIIGGKYIYVRGLGDRYSNTELNGMSLPSPNPIKRTVPLDMFPSMVIGSLQVQKTFTPDITGAFGGGYVNVRTKSNVDEDHASIKMGINAHDSAGKDATTYEGADSDWTGYDHSFRPFPGSFNSASLPTVGSTPPTLNYTDAELRSMLQRRDVNAQSTTVPYGGEVQVEFGKQFTIADEHELSLLASYGYKGESSLRTYTSYDYLVSRDGVQTPTPDNTATNDMLQTTIQHGGIISLGYQFRNLELQYTKLFVLNTLDQTRDVNGTFGENNSKEHQYYFEWQERELNIDQLSGGLDYKLWVDNRFDFGAELAQASEYVPNDVYYNYKQYFSTQPYVFARPDSMLSYSHRTTDDKLYNVYAKNRAQVPMLSDEDYLEAGIVTEHKEREGRRVDLQMQSNIKDLGVSSGPINGIINYGDGSDLDFSLTSLPRDQYNAELDRNAYYVKGMIKPTEAMDITFGGRYVDLRQTVEQYQVDNNIIVLTPNTLKFNKVLPSLGMTYRLDDSNQFRLAYSETFIYPDFREFVNAEFMHPLYLAKVAGNPGLIETDIQSIDARYEYYMNETDALTAALFYKHMDNPIEDTRAFTTGTLPRFSFDNSKAAELAGIELSWYKHLDFIDSSLENVSFGGNYTYIYSKVELTPEQQAKFVTQDRGLQGLSPQVLNLSLTYDDPKTRSVNLSYNKMARRLMRVALKNGDVILGLDDYEIPPHLLDFTWIEKFEVDALNTTLDLTFKVKNLLDDETVWEQGSQTTFKYKTGRSYSFSVRATF